MKSLVFLLVACALVLQVQCNIILKPSKVSELQAGFIMVQGASIPVVNYKKFALQLQDKFQGSLWVALVDFPLDFPEPLMVSSQMSSAFDSLKKSGFNFNSNTPFFFCGHSLGGIIVQNYLFANLNQFPFSFKGLILEGSFISRSNLDKAKTELFAPVLTLGGELDGLARITRMAEAYYHNNNENSFDKSFTILINGMNHYQFSGEGVPPSNVANNDITPEIDNDNARDQITNVINSFLNYQLKIQTPQDTKVLTDYSKSTKDLVSPLIEGFNLESFYHFKPPCSNSNSLNCTVGSLWTQTAQTYMGSIGSKLLVSDTLRSVFSVPEHFPSLKNCSTQMQQSCALNASTFTDNVYTFFDNFDVGLQPIAATEARTKMQSRQSVLEAFTGKKFNFTQTDETGNLCGDINQQAITWALKAAPVNTVKRYLEKGKMLQVVDDIKCSTGFTWIGSSLSFKTNVDEKNRTFVELGSPTLRTSTDSWIVAGYHYCKLLTPARAIEWIYVDSVKP